MRMPPKLLGRKDLAEKANTLRSAGKRIVFTNGCFDILHVGHVRYLSSARNEGDVLVVGLNSDKSIKSIKKENRPVIPEDQRAEVLAGLWCVDYVTLFDEPDPLSLIQAVRPDVLVKGADWAEAEIVGADFVTATGGKVVRVEMVPCISTSQIIQRIIEIHK